MKNKLGNSVQKILCAGLALGLSCDIFMSPVYANRIDPESAADSANRNKTADENNENNIVDSQPEEIEKSEENNSNSGNGNDLEVPVQEADKEISPVNETENDEVEEQANDFDIVNGTLVSYNGWGKDHVTVPDGVVRIGVHAFSHTYVKTVKLPESVKYIDADAFYYADNLESINLPDGLVEIGNDAFGFTSSLKEIRIPKELQKIDDFAFRNSGIVNIDWNQDKSIPLEIGYRAFINCSFLKKVELPEYQINCLYNIPFSQSAVEEIIIPDNISDYEIPAGIFSECEKLKQIYIPENVKRIGESSFSNSGLEKITFSESSKEALEIGNCAFGGNLYLKEIVIPGYVELIEHEAFSYTGLENVLFLNSKDNELEIGQFAFSNCQKLIEITLPSHLSKLGTYAFSESGVKNLAITSINTKYDGDIFSYGHPLESVILPDGIKEVPRIFSCTKIRSITLPDSVETIPYSTFSGCSELESIEFSNNLKTIENYAFSGCSNLRSLNFKENLAVIKSNAFESCTNLEEVYLPSTLNSIYDRAFYNCPSINKVVFNSSEYVWNHIYIESWGNEDLTQKDIQFASEKLFNPELTIQIPGDPEVYKNLQINYKGNPARLSAFEIEISQNGTDFEIFKSVDLKRTQFPYNLTVRVEEVLEENESIGKRQFRLKAVDRYGEEAFSETIEAYFRRSSNALIIEPGDSDGQPTLRFDSNLSNLDQSRIKSARIYQSFDGEEWEEIPVHSTKRACITDTYCTKTYAVLLKDTLPFTEPEKESYFKITYIMEYGDNIELEPASYVISRVPLSNVEDLFLVESAGNGLEIKVSPKNWDRILVKSYTVTVSDENGEVFSQEFTGLKSQSISGVHNGYDLLDADVVITVNLHDGSEERGSFKAQLEGAERPAIENIDFGFAEKSMPLNSSLQLKPVLAPVESGGEIRYESSSPETVSVTEKGLLKALKRGGAEITAYYGDNRSTTVKITVTNPETFSDVPKNHWAANVIAEASRLGIMTGLNDEQFGPDETMTRGMAAVVIHRLAGAPNPIKNASFKDVPASAYYYRAVSWCYEQGIVSGYENNTFGPDDAISREQIAVIIRNFLMKQGVDTNKKADLTKFADYKNVSSFAVSALEFCVSQGIMSGAENGTKLNPTTLSNRAECAKMFLMASKLK